MTDAHNSTSVRIRSGKNIENISGDIDDDVFVNKLSSSQPKTRDRPSSELIKRSDVCQNSTAGEHSNTVSVSRPTLRRHVSFNLDHRRPVNAEEYSKEKQETASQKKKSVARQCSFQQNQHRNESHSNESHVHHETLSHQENPNKKKSLADMLPELMKKFKSELGCKSFIVNTRKAVERKRQFGLDNPQERQWMKGSDMQAFYHTWQTSDDHLKDQSVRPSTVRRNKSLPKNFRAFTPAVVDSRKLSKKDISEFGIVRECCSHPRMRIPSFQD